MRAMLIAALSGSLLIWAGAGALRDAGANAAEAPLVLAQACGWYVIAGCYRNWSQAQNRAQSIGAFVVDTSSGAYPNFNPGWYCAAFGPYDQWTAKSKSRYIKPSYIKNSC